MANIFGNIKYLSKYSSIEELKRDINIQVDKLVIVKENDEAIALYSIVSEKKSETYVRLDNGLFAVKALTNSQAVDLGTYSTPSPVQVQVGGVGVGREFSEASFADVFNAIFFPDVDISFDINLNLSSLFYLIGEEIMLTKVSVENITSEVVETIELYIEGEQVRVDEVGKRIDSYEFLINRIINSTSEVTVRVRTRNSYLDQSKTITFSNPLYWGVVDSNFELTIGTVRNLNRDVIENNKLDIEVATSGQCIFLAVEADKEAYQILDESSHNIVDNFREDLKELVLNSEKVVYRTYKSNVTSIPMEYKYALQFRFRKVEVDT